MIELEYHSWMEQAACADLEDPDVMFPSLLDRDALSRAKSICARCPVIDQCRSLAKGNREAYGVWAGDYGSGDAIVMSDGRRVCKAGHSMTGANLRETNRGGRVERACRECDRERAANVRDRRKMGIPPGKPGPAPANKGWCVECHVQTITVLSRGPKVSIPKGAKRYAGRGLCANCYDKARRARQDA